MCLVEGTLNHALRLLDTIRGYYLQQPNGEQYPFVQKIDAILPRQQSQTPDQSSDTSGK